MQGLALPTSAPPPLLHSPWPTRFPLPNYCFQFQECTRFFFPAQSLPIYSFPFVPPVWNVALNPLSDFLQHHLAYLAGSLSFFRCQLDCCLLSLLLRADPHPHPNVPFLPHSHCRCSLVFPSRQFPQFLLYIYLYTFLFSVCLSKQMLLAISVLEGKLRHIKFLTSLFEQQLIWLRQCQTKVSRGAPLTEAKRKTLTEKTQKYNKEIT